MGVAVGDVARWPRAVATPAAQVAAVAVVEMAAGVADDAAGAIFIVHAELPSTSATV